MGGACQTAPHPCPGVDWLLDISCDKHSLLGRRWDPLPSTVYWWSTWAVSEPSLRWGNAPPLHGSASKWQQRWCINCYMYDIHCLWGRLSIYVPTYFMNFYQYSLLLSYIGQRANNSNALKAFTWFGGQMTTELWCVRCRPSTVLIISSMFVYFQVFTLKFQSSPFLCFYGGYRANDEDQRHA